jgi:hypothetical protein
LSARPESNLDRNFDTRLRLYHQLIDRQGLNPLLNNGSLEEMFILVASRLGIRQ